MLKNGKITTNAESDMMKKGGLVKSAFFVHN